MMLQRTLITKIASALIFTSATLAAPAAFASGSMTPSSSQGADAYSIGKSIFFKQVACEGCAYAFMAKGSADVKTLFTSLNSKDSKVKLSEGDLEAVNTYLTKRFNLTITAGK